jgi:hypothetical protein
MTDKAVIDRIVDGEHVVLLVGDEEQERIVPRSRLPEGASEGSWLRVRFEGDTLVEIAVDPAQSLQTQQRVEDKMARLRLRGRRLPPA